MRYLTNKTATNIGLAIWRMKCFYETFVQGSTLGIPLNSRVKIRHIAKPKNVICHFRKPNDPNKLTKKDMFRHKGKTRTLTHNLRIASLLSFVAGVVNVAGFLAVQKLTTNVTGHFAFFVDEVFKQNFWEGLNYFLYILFFFLGSFFSSFSIELTSKINDRLIYRIPVVAESLILISVAIFGQEIISKAPNILAYSLLFAMGLQNSLVTTISNATVRTTHLTGLFTDLGIELSQLFFYKLKEQKDKLYSSIKLRLTIISFFFFGGLLGGIFYSIINLYVLAFAGLLLLIGLIYDDIKLKLKRQLR